MESIKIILFFSVLFLIPLVLAIQVGNQGTEGVNFKPTIPINYSTVNVNNSLYWQGHTGTDGSWLTGISLVNSSYYLASNPSNFYNSSTLPSQSINGTHINVLTINSTSQTINGNLNVIGQFNLSSGSTPIICSNSSFTAFGTCSDSSLSQYGYKVIFNTQSAWLGNFYIPTPYRIFVTEIGSNSAGANLIIDSGAGKDIIFKNDNAVNTTMIIKNTKIIANRSLEVVGNLNVTGNITATNFIGNGSRLTSVCLSNGSNCANSGVSNYNNITMLNKSNTYRTSAGLQDFANNNIITTGTGTFGGTNYQARIGDETDLFAGQFYYASTGNMVQLATSAYAINAVGYNNFVSTDSNTNVQLASPYSAFNAYAGTAANAGYFADGAGHTATFADQFTTGYLTDSTNTVYLADGTCAINFVGGVNSNGQIGLSDCYDSSLGGQVCSDNGIVYSITDDPSDKSFKDNVKNLTLDLNKFNQLKPSTWEWNNNYTGKQGQSATGLIADDLQSVYPSLVKEGSHKEVVGYKNITKTIIINQTIYHNETDKKTNKTIKVPTIIQVPKNITTSSPIWNITTYKTIDYAGVISLQTKKIQELETEQNRIKDCAKLEDYKQYQECIIKQ